MEMDESFVIWEQLMPDLQKVSTELLDSLAMRLVEEITGRQTVELADRDCDVRLVPLDSYTAPF